MDHRPDSRARVRVGRVRWPSVGHDIAHGAQVAVVDLNDQHNQRGLHVSHDSLAAFWCSTPRQF